MIGWRRRGLGAWLAVVVLGCPAVRAEEPGREVLADGLKRFLSGATDALGRRDWDAVEGVLSGATMDGRERFFEGLRALPLEGILPVVAPRVDVARRTEGWEAAVPLRLVLRLRGLPSDPPFLVAWDWRLRWEGGAWRVVEARIPDDETPFWMRGFTRWHNSEHFLIGLRPGTATEGRLGATERQLERAWRDLDDAGLEPPSGALVLFVDDPRLFRELSGMEAGSFSGVARWRYVGLEDGVRVVNAVLLIDDFHLLENRPGFSLRDRRETMTHELVHLALATDTRPYTPIWLSEGLATVYADQYGRRERRELARSGRLESLRLADLGPQRRPGDERDQAFGAMEYRYSAAAVSHLIDEHGADRVLGFYRDFARLKAEELEAFLPAARAQLSDPETMDARALATPVAAALLRRWFDLAYYELDAATRAEVD